MSLEVEKALRLMDLKFFAEGKHKVSLSDFKEKLLKGEVILLDVREEAEVKLVSLPFSLHIPLKELPDRVNEVPKEKLVAVFCPCKIRATMAYLYLFSKGFDKVRLLDATFGELVSIFTPPYVEKLKKK